MPTQRRYDEEMNFDINSAIEQLSDNRLGLAESARKSLGFMNINGQWIEVQLVLEKNQDNWILKPSQHLKKEG